MTAMWARGFRRLRLLSSLVFAAALMPATPPALHGDDETLAAYNWAHPNTVVVPPVEMAFTSRDIGSAKNEGLYVWAYSPEGTLLLFCLFHIEAQLIDRWGMYALVVDPEGDVYWATKRPASREVSYSETELRVSDGSTSFCGSDGSYRLICNIDGLSCDVQLDSRMPAWKPGTGTVNYTADGSCYQTRILVAPWAHASGRVSVEGIDFHIQGHGYVGKTRFSNPLTRFAPYFHSLRVYSDDSYLYLLDVTLNDAYDNRVIPTLGFAWDDKWLFTARNYVFTVDSWSAAGDLPYLYPTRIRIECEGDGYSLVGVYEQTRLVRVTDMFDELPAIAGRILGLVLSRPMYVRAIGDFTGTLTTPDGSSVELSMSGPYEYAIVR